MLTDRFLQIVGKFTRKEDGATAIEYGLIASLISMAIAIAVFAFGDTLSTLFYSGLSVLLAP
jgi:pilus assembly protein Flp/PilA